MNRMTDSEHNGQAGAPPSLANDEIDELRRAYKRALDEYLKATSAINDHIRRRVLPTGEEFARQRVAHFALVEARRTITKASKPRTSRPH